MVQLGWIDDVLEVRPCRLMDLRYIGHFKCVVAHYFRVEESSCAWINDIVRVDTRALLLVLPEETLALRTFHIYVRVSRAWLSRCKGF